MKLFSSLILAFSLFFFSNLSACPCSYAQAPRHAWRAWRHSSRPLHPPARSTDVPLHR